MKMTNFSPGRNPCGYVESKIFTFNISNVCAAMGKVLADGVDTCIWPDWITT